MSGQRNKRTSIDRIRDYYEDKFDEVVLTQKDEDIRERLTFAFAMLSKARPVQQVANYMEKHFNISSAQAFRDIRNAKNLFGDVSKSSKDGDRAVLYELGMKGYRKAVKADDHKTAAAYYGHMIKLKALDRDDPDLPDFEKLQPNVYPIIMSEQLEQKLDKLLETPGPLNLSKFLNNQAEEAEIIEDDGGKKESGKAGNSQAARKR